MSGTLPTSGGYAGAAWQNTGKTPHSAIDFLVRQIVAGMAFSAMVQVKAVHGGGVGSPPTVDVQPMVNQVDGFGNQVPHGTIYNLPCFRLQGGNGAVILDPAVGDIGEAVICDRDISTVKQTRAVSGPGSFRQNDWADGCYFGAFLGATPTDYVHIIGGGGIHLVTASPLTITASNVTLDAAGNLAVLGDITAGVGGGDQIGLRTHRHTQPNDSHGDAEQPTNAPTAGT